jgi:hypothetical protein
VADLSEQSIVYSRDLDEVDRVFTAIMQMTALGEVCIDLGHPLGDASLLSEPVE